MTNDKDETVSVGSTVVNDGSSCSSGYMWVQPTPQVCPTCGRCPTCGGYGAPQQPYITYTGFTGSTGTDDR